jgi:hypothetical protein
MGQEEEVDSKNYILSNVPMPLNPHFSLIIREN